MANGFTYCWSNHETKKVYVGVHLGDIDDGYICSSKSMLEEYGSCKELFTRQILFIGDYAICASFEKSLISGLFKQKKDTFYNRSNGKKILFDDTIRQKMRDMATGRKMSIEAVEKMRLTKIGKPSPRKGMFHSEESKLKMSISRKGLTSPNKGKSFTAEQRLKMSESAKNKPPTSLVTRGKLSLATTLYWLNKKKGLSLV